MWCNCSFITLNWIFLYEHTFSINSIFFSWVKIRIMCNQKKIKKNTYHVSIMISFINMLVLNWLKHLRLFLLLSCFVASRNESLCVPKKKKKETNHYSLIWDYFWFQQIVFYFYLVTVSYGTQREIRFYISFHLDWFWVCRAFIFGSYFGW